MSRPRPFSPLLVFALLALPALYAGCRARDSQAPDSPAQASAPAAAAPSPATAPPPAASPPGSTAPAPGGNQAVGQVPDGRMEGERPSDLPRDRPLRAAFLVVEGVSNTELMAPFDVFHHSAFHAKPQPGIEVFTVSPDGRPLRTFEGLQITPRYSFANAPEADILVIPSARGSMDRDLQNRAMIDWVRTAGERARYVLSLSDGTFVLAQAGLLEGRAATTFPDDYERFARTFPKVDLRINVNFVHSGKFLTSQGGARSYMAAMHLVDWLYGDEVAKKIAHGLLLPWPPRPGGPMQVIEPATEPAAAP
ncbi:MAG TPA: DJ-1/PfpI family protein [Thermoanaerobaculia bacterium]|nr:DJ-1/PfpI family protein [Thermoanaerobaculia bacterium]